MLRAARFGLLAALLCALAAPLHAQQGQNQPSREQAGPRSDAAAGQRREAPDANRLPSPSVTTHTLDLPGRSLAFTATAGALTLTDPQGAPQAEYAYVSYTLDRPSGPRPVTFAINGGPGSASAYLHLLALGPWRLPLDGASISPSAPTALVPNAETWLDFTDLVFIDPPGTGYSRVLGGDQARERLYSVEGDIDGIAAFVTRWLKEKNRLDSPKFFVGESYGGFRGPLVADKLQSDQGIGLSGLILVSPVLDFGWFSQGPHAPWVYATRLPSLAAARLEEKGPLTRASLRDVESYASGEYLVDLMKGPGDAAAIERVSTRVADLTGLDRGLVQRLSGRIDSSVFQREFRRGAGVVVSAYDTGTAALDPQPNAYYARFEDPVLGAMTAPLTSAVLKHLGETLNWKVEGRYNLSNGAVNNAWRWGRGRGQPESLSELRKSLALDPKLRVLVAHGYHRSRHALLRDPAPPEPAPAPPAATGRAFRFTAAATCSTRATPRAAPSAPTRSGCSKRR